MIAFPWWSIACIPHPSPPLRSIMAQRRPRLGPPGEEDVFVVVDRDTGDMIVEDITHYDRDNAQYHPGADPSDIPRSHGRGARRHHHHRVTRMSPGAILARVVIALMVLGAGGLFIWAMVDGTKDFVRKTPSPTPAPSPVPTPAPTFLPCTMPIEGNISCVPDFIFSWPCVTDGTCSKMEMAINPISGNLTMINRDGFGDPITITEWDPVADTTYMTVASVPTMTDPPREIAYWPQQGVWIIFDNDDNIYISSLDFTNVTLVGTFAVSKIKSITVLPDGRMFGTKADSNDLYQIDPTAWGSFIGSPIAMSFPDYPGTDIDSGKSIAYNAHDGTVYVSVEHDCLDDGIACPHPVPFGAIGTLNVTSGEITPTCFPDDDVLSWATVPESITFGVDGAIYLQPATDGFGPPVRYSVWGLPSAPCIFDP